MAGELVGHVLPCGRGGELVASTDGQRKLLALAVVGDGFAVLDVDRLHPPRQLVDRRVARHIVAVDEEDWQRNFVKG